jgi:hypothetical protein
MFRAHLSFLFQASILFSLSMIRVPSRRIGIRGPYRCNSASSASLVFRWKSCQPRWMVQCRRPLIRLRRNGRGTLGWLRWYRMSVMRGSVFTWPFPRRAARRLLVWKALAGTRLLGFDSAGRALSSGVRRRKSGLNVDDCIVAIAVGGDRGVEAWWTRLEFDGRLDELSR